MQTMLIKLGYSCGSAGIDGDFGNNTKAALEKFQKENGLTVDGLYGPKSKEKLTKLYNDINAPKENKTIEEIANEVINGKWGNNLDRKNRLEAAGYNYNIIQNKVNELINEKNKNTTVINDDIDIDIKTDYAQSFNTNIAKTYTTIANLRLRTGAGISKKIITIIPKNAKVTCYGYYTDDWYYVKYNNYTGFCHRDYLK